MIVLCPKCKTKYRVDETKIGEEGVRLRCRNCQTIFRVRKPKAAPAEPPPAPAPKPEAQAPKPAAPAPEPPSAPAPPPAALASISGPILPAQASKATILIADADEEYLAHMTGEMVQAGYTVYQARDGLSAMRVIQEKLPEVAILEVVLPQKFGFEISEQIKTHPALKDKIKVILLGSVYEKERFRRAPQSLYGADDYVEKHHDGKQVLAKISELLEPKAAPAAAPPLASPRPVPAPPPRPAAPPIPSVPKPAAPPSAPPSPEPAPPPRPAAPPIPSVPKPAAPPTPPPPPAPAPKAVAPGIPPGAGAWAQSVPDDPAHQKAARLARTIVADIALYNPKELEQGLREGNWKEILAKDIEDGKKHWESKTLPEIRSTINYFDLALQDLIERKKKEFGLA